MNTQAQVEKRDKDGFLEPPIPVKRAKNAIPEEENVVKADADSSPSQEKPASDALIQQIESDWEQIPKKYDEIFNLFTTTFNEIYEKLFSNLQLKVQSRNSEVQSLIAQIQHHMTINSQLRKKIAAIQAQTVNLHNSITRN